MIVLLLSVIRLYRRLVSPYLPPTCRFHPTCSAYAEEAIARHGALRGLALTLGRLARCQPWGGAGLDLVPAPGRPRKSV